MEVTLNGRVIRHRVNFTVRQGPIVPVPGPERVRIRVDSVVAKYTNAFGEWEIDKVRYQGWDIGPWGLMDGQSRHYKVPVSYWELPDPIREAVDAAKPKES